MAYQKQTWKDEILTGPERYRIEQSGVISHPSASIELITDISQAASPVNAARMNHIEDGIGQNSGDITQLRNDITKLNNDVYHLNEWFELGWDSNKFTALGTDSRSRYRKIGRMIEFQILGYEFTYSGPSTVYTDSLIAHFQYQPYYPTTTYYYPAIISKTTNTNGYYLPMIGQAYFLLGNTGKLYFSFRSIEELPTNMITQGVLINCSGVFPCNVNTK